MLIGKPLDMHMKETWSLIYPEQRHVSLAPAYDFCGDRSLTFRAMRTNMKIRRAKGFLAFSWMSCPHLAWKAAITEKDGDLMRLKRPSALSGH